MEKVVQSAETLVKVNDVELCYDTFGDPVDPAMMLVNGLGGQMIGMDEVSCRVLAAAGFFVVRFDNRDVGKSTKFETAGVPSVEVLRSFWCSGKGEISAPYVLKDMAQDVVGLLDALNIDAAHVLGVSMGGMIGQLMCIHFPDRVRTFISGMSCPGYSQEWMATEEARESILQAPPADCDAYCEFKVERARIMHGTKYPLNEELVRTFAKQEFDRSYYPQGMKRQLAAIFVSGNWTEALKSVEIPTLVVHGDADPLVPVEGGKATAAAIPDSKLIVVEGMGHSIPEAEAPRLSGAILQHTK